MRIAIIGPPFIEIPPRRYGGTELFVGNLACELHAAGHDVTVYGNGESRLPCPVRWRYPHAEWPPDSALRADLKNADHTAWSIHDAMQYADVIHLNDAVGAAFTLLADVPVVMTIHHTREPDLSAHYMRYPDIHYVAIAQWLARAEPMKHVHVVHHGIPVSDYRFREKKDDYVAFLGRMAPCKAPHLAIEAARRAGVRLKLAGEIQPVFQDYWEQRVLPFIDGELIEYVGEADFEKKNVLLSHARALLFPIQWDEPFGLVMIEAMACGTPVLAFRGGSVEEIVEDGTNGWICRDVEDMARRMAAIGIAPAACRKFVQQRFSVRTMAERYVGVYRSAVGSRHERLALGA